MNQLRNPNQAVLLLHTTESAINRAVELGASDIHITPTATSYRVQLRVHGVMSQAVEVQHETGRSLIQAFKAEGK